MNKIKIFVLSMTLSSLAFAGAAQKVEMGSVKNFIAFESPETVEQTNKENNALLQKNKLIVERIIMSAKAKRDLASNKLSIAKAFTAQGSKSLSKANEQNTLFNGKEYAAFEQNLNKLAKEIADAQKEYSNAADDFVFKHFAYAVATDRQVFPLPQSFFNAHKYANKTAGDYNIAVQAFASFYNTNYNEEKYGVLHKPAAKK